MYLARTVCSMGVLGPYRIDISLLIIASRIGCAEHCCKLRALDIVFGAIVKVHVFCGAGLPSSL